MSRHHIFFLRAAALVLLLPLAASAEVPPLPEKIEFNRDVRPILSDNCFKCHGFDEKTRDGGRRLDTFEGATADIDGLRAIVPGNLAESDLHIRIHSKDRDEKMPPAKAHKTLTERQVAILDRWIEQGAKYEAHWAFQKPQRPAVPQVQNSPAPLRNPIDAFITVRLQQEGLTLSPEADKATLIRRVSLDLTGLPPTLAEIDSFLGDQSPDAYEKLVERLLASPEHGEQWGRHWLDAARYADSNGFEKDATRSIWPYRDWVINAINRDLPFDQFTIEQIAGDLLPDATLDQKVATGYLRNAMLNEEGGVDPEQFRVEAIIDRVETIGRAHLGLTVQCAQCHSHKFDPISHTDYFKMYAFLNNDEEAQMDVPSAAQRKEREEILKKIAEIEKELRKDAELAQRMAAWEEKVATQAGEWTLFTDAELFGAVGTKFEKLADGSYIQRGDRQDTGLFTLTVKNPPQNITGFRVELLTDPTLPLGGPGIAQNGNVVISDFVVKTHAPDGSGEQKIELHNPTADFAQKDFEVEKAIDGDDKTTGWGIDAGPPVHIDRKAVFQTKAPLMVEEGKHLAIALVQKWGKKHVIGRFRLSYTTANDPKADPLPTHVRQIIAKPAAERTEEEQRALFSHYRTTDEKFTEANKQIDELLAKWPIGAFTLTLADRTGGRETRLFKRGDWQQLGERVEPGSIGILPPHPASEPASRLTFAKWLVDPAQPTVARVMVNRFWQTYFGTGLLETPEDFGMQADLPSHPELLDWLATEFIAQKWSMKAMHRLIVTSATYRQSTKATPELYARDPYNRLLARGPRFRVQAENVRDVALAASGLLTKKIGGPSVFPPIPESVLSMSYGGFSWPTSEGEDRYRRGLYTFWKRSNPYPSMAVFDAPAGEKSCGRRTRSNTPLQALTTLNDATFHEAAQALALRVYREGGADDRARAAYGFRLCTGRAPEEREVDVLLQLLEREQQSFDHDTAQAVAVTLQDPAKMPKGVNLHKVAPWTMVARVLLNLDETLTKQ